MQPAVEKHEFQAEVKQLLDLMIHSLYSDKDIFLRELISNASDALDKCRFEQLTNPELGAAGDLHIRIEVDPAARTLAISDTGIGMSRDEVIANIGTIARSGTREFLAKLEARQKPELSPELIGQFGVGFYSAFMVADRIALETRRLGEATATRWESVGDGTYSISEAGREGHGTTITLHLKPADTEHGMRDYATPEAIKDIVKRFSDFVAYPIKLGDETINSMKAIWDRPKSEVTEDEYREFYRHISHDWTPPLRTIPVKMEGTLEAYALLYIPAKPAFDLYSPEMKRGLQLYVKRVFVMDECRELMPAHLRFIKGVVDAHDLSLNVSREILQKDRQIPIIRKQLVKKALGTLDEMKADHFEDEYLGFWASFGPVLKEGLLAFEAQETEKLLELVIAPSTASAKLSSLADYVGRMKEGQDEIYFLSGTSKDAVAKSPLLEGFVAQGYEVLLFSDPIDELWLERGPSYKGKPLVSIGRGEVKLGSEEERKKTAESLAAKSEEYAALLTSLRGSLQHEVKEVRLSSRLTSSPACLVADEDDLTPRMQQMLAQMGQTAPKSRPILELNPKHDLLPKLQTIHGASSADPRLPLYATLLLGQAHLAESGQVPDPAAFSQALADLMLRSV